MSRAFACTDTGHSASKNKHAVMRTLTCDILDLQSNLFSRDSLKIVGACVPVYILSRQCDTRVHRYFYDYKKHANIRQLPYWCTVCANVGVLAVPMLIAGAQAFFAPTQARIPAQVFLISLPFTWATKRLLKLFTWDCCLRPPCQEFVRSGYFYGGFPSGHMFEAAYMAALFGTTYGRRWAIPLTCGAVFMGVSFIACNRHYLSQLVAGAVLGLVYARATHKLIHKKLSAIKLSLSGTSCKFSYIF